MNDELLGTARRLALASPKKPRQSDLKRAVSTAYYALFHALARNGADLMAGSGASASPAWLQIYRGLEHGSAKTACSALKSPPFSATIVNCGDAFVLLQAQRHAADYDPSVRLSRADALAAIELAEGAIHDLRSSSRAERLAFAAHLLFRRR